MTRRHFLYSAPAYLTPAALFAKGRTVRVTIAGSDLALPIEITEPAAARFQVWTGPGTSTNEPQSLMVNWAGGFATPPKEGPVYEVSFHTTRGDPGTYVVLYTIDLRTNQGYVKIPAGDHAAYRDNTRLIYRDVEGSWFRAWVEWDKLAQPLLAERRAG